MEAILIRKVFTDEWVAREDSRFSQWIRWVRPVSWVLPPHPRRPVEFQSYVLGYRLEPTPRELSLIRAASMFGHIAFTLRAEDRPITLADALGPELIPEVSRWTGELLKVEALIREAAVVWSHFFQSMPDPKAG